MNVGEIRASLVATFDDRGFQRFDTALNGTRERAKQGAHANLGGNFEERGFQRFTSALDGARGRAREAVHAKLGGSTETKAFEQFDQHVTGSRERAKQAIRAQLGGQFDEAAFTRYQTAANRAQQRARDREAFKAHLGGDFNSSAFNAYERQLNQTGQTHSRWSRSIQDNNKSASGSFGSLAKGVIAVGGAFAAFNFAKGAITDTISLSGAVAKLSAITGMDITTTSKWIEIFKVRGVETNRVAMGFISLSRQIRTAQDDEKKHGDAVSQATQKYREQVDALKQSGASHDKVAAAEKKNSEALDLLKEKTTKSTSAFRELGVSEAAIRSGDTQRVLLESADGLAKIENPARRAALAQQLFGRQAQALIPIMSKGRQGVQDALDAAQRYGAFLPKNAQQLAQAREAQRNLNLAWDGLKISFTQAVLPALVQGAQKLLAFIAQMRSGQGAGGDFARVISGAFHTIKDVVTTVVGAFGGLGNTLRILIGLWATYKIIEFYKALQALFILMTASPVGRFVAVLAILAGAFLGVDAAQGKTADSAKRVKQAWDQAIMSAKELRDGNLRVLQAQLQVKLADDQVTQAQQAVTKAANEFGRNSPQYRDALDKLTQATLDDKQAHNELGDAQDGVKQSEQKVTQARQAAEQPTRDSIATLKDLIAHSSEYGLTANDVRQSEDALKQKEAELQRQQQQLNDTINGMPDHKTTRVDILVNAAVSGAAHGSVGNVSIGNIGLQRGGMIRAAMARGGILPGTGREDTQIVAAAPGEGFLTRHQMPVVDAAMKIAHAVGFPFRSLGHVWGAITAPHGSGAPPSESLQAVAHGGVVGDAWSPYEKHLKQKFAATTEFIKRIWKVAAPFYHRSPRSEMPNLTYTQGKDGLFVGVDLGGHQGPGHRQMFIPDWIVQSSKDAGPGLDVADPDAITLLLHEWTHQFQRKDKIDATGRRTHPPKNIDLYEGGAESHAERISSSVLSALGIRRRARWDRPGDLYYPYVQWVNKHLGPKWVANTQFGFQRGGLVGFQSGGRVPAKKKKPPPPKPTPQPPGWQQAGSPGGLGEPVGPAVGPATSNTTTAQGYANTISGTRSGIDRLEHEYGSLDQLYSINTEVLVNPDTGLVDHDAVNRRLAQLAQLGGIRTQIFQAWQRVVAMTQQLINSYKLILKALNRTYNSIKTKGLKGKALASAQKHQRDVKSAIDKYTGLMSSAAGDLTTARDDQDSSWLDSLRLTHEYSSVKNTQPTAQPAPPPDTTPPPVDTPPPTGDGSGGSGGGGTPSPPSPAEIAAAALVQFNAFQAQRADLFRNFGTNLVAASGTSPFAGLAGQAAGGRFFGGGAPDAGPGPAGDTTYHFENHFAEGPPDPHTWSHQQRFQAEAAMG